MWVLFLQFFRQTQAHFKVCFSRFGYNYVIKPIFYTVAMIILTLNEEQDYMVMHDNLQVGAYLKGQKPTFFFFLRDQLLKLEHGKSSVLTGLISLTVYQQNGLKDLRKWKTFKRLCKQNSKEKVVVETKPRVQYQYLLLYTEHHVCRVFQNFALFFLVAILLLKSSVM